MGLIDLAGITVANIITDLPHLGLLRISGEGAKKLLQGQLTCDLEVVSHTQTRLGAHCNPQGRVISLFRLFMYHDQYYMQMPLESLPVATAALKKYAVFFKVELQDESNELNQLGFIGEPLTNFPKDIDEAALINDVLVIKVPGTEPRFICIGNKIDKSHITENAQSITDNTWKSLDLQAGIPAIYPETSDEFLPHELNLPQLNAVSFQKGCYTGQEIIARMEYRGKLKHHLYYAKAKTEQAPQHGQDIYREKDICGKVVDFCQVSYNNFELLVVAPEQDVKKNPLALDPETKAILEF